ncbi:MAG: hypothetical protein JXQ73_23000 [Phycisphaerae bacterium]|nr:hypothetical protein [Phycisphaerae bacterium]
MRYLPKTNRLRHPSGRLALLALLTLAAQPSCSRDQTGGATPPAPAPTSQISTPPAEPALSPQQLANVVAGAAPKTWRLSGSLEQFTPKDLYEKIDGRAELFLSYDVAGLTFAGFQAPHNADLYLDVYVYDMKTPTNAFGIFSVERSPDEPPVDLGRAACRSDANLFIWKGRYYVKIMASEETDDARQAGQTLAQKLIDALPDSADRVWGRAAMPTADRVPRSLRYFNVDAMGLDFMRETYTARFVKAGQSIEAFLSRQDSPAAAEAILAQYEKHAKTYGKSAERVATGGAEFRVCDMGGVFDVVAAKGPLVIGVTGVQNRRLALQTATDLRKQLSDPTNDRQSSTPTNDRQSNTPTNDR